jgi:hypothetical protein
MQMFYADFSWYGAGAIRYGFKNNRGEVIYCHRTPNNNINTEAYMRSGNLPARYETNTMPVRTYLTATLAAGATSMTVNDTTFFPSVGVLTVTAAADTGGAIEYIYYTGKTATTFTGLQRNSANTTGVALGTSTATTFTYSATAPVLVESFSPGQASTVSHWGSSVIMDGQYDNDKSFLFNYGQNQQATYTNTGQRYPVFSVRLAPSVDNGSAGVLGQREIINRMQLAPASMGIFASNNAVRAELVLNARVSSGTYVPVGGSSLAQFAVHGPTAGIYGGESIFTFFVPPNNTDTQDLTKLRDIGNSILAGGQNNSVSNTSNQIYPDGPDILTLCITPVGGAANVAARLSWTEAQA